MAARRRLNESTGKNPAREEKKEARGRLRTLQDWARMLESSRTEPVLVFKHSPTCGVSSHVLADVDGFVAKHRNIPFGIVHVVEDRGLSNAIEEQTGIRHESPQMIAIRNEQPIWHASHWSIDFKELKQLLLGVL